MKKSICLAALLALPACGTVNDAYQVDSLVVDQENYRSISGDDQVVPKPLDLKKDPFPDDPPKREGVAADASSAGSEAVEPIDSGEVAKPIPVGALARARKTAKERNQLMYLLIRNSDQLCASHKASIVAYSATTELATTELTTVLAGLAATLTPASTVQALAGAAAITNAAGVNFKEITYQKYVAPAITKEIDKARDEKLVKLDTNSRLTIEKYTADEMLSDVIKYHEQCSFFVGLTRLTSDKQQIESASAELARRMEELRTQIDVNNAQIAEMDKGTQEKSINNLNAANESLSKQLQVLTKQYGLLQSPPVPSEAVVVQ